MRTHNYLLLSNSVLVINQAMFLNSIAHSDQILGHLINEFLGHEALATLQLLPRFQHILLLLEYTEPCRIKLAPETDPIAVQCNFVYSKTLSENY